MQFRKMAYFLEDGDTLHFHHGHVVEYEGKLWLVLGWIPLQNTEKSWPTRMVCLKGLRFQLLDDTIQGAGYLLYDLLPRYIHDRVLPGESSKLEILECPPLQIETRLLD